MAGLLKWSSKTTAKFPAASYSEFTIEHRTTTVVVTTHYWYVTRKKQVLQGSTRMTSHVDTLLFSATLALGLKHWAFMYMALSHNGHTVHLFQRKDVLVFNPPVLQLPA